MEKRTLAVKIHSKVMERLRRYCAERGIKQGFFVEKAVLGEIERDELASDLLDFRRHRPDEAASLSFEEYLRLRDA